MMARRKTSFASLRFKDSIAIRHEYYIIFLCTSLQNLQLIRHLKPPIVYCCICLGNDPQKCEEKTIQDYVKGAQAVNRVVWILSALDTIRQKAERYYSSTINETFGRGSPSLVGRGIANPMSERTRGFESHSPRHLLIIDFTISSNFP